MKEELVVVRERVLRGLMNVSSILVKTDEGSWVSHKFTQEERDAVTSLYKEAVQNLQFAAE